MAAAVRLGNGGGAQQPPPWGGENSCLLASGAVVAVIWHAESSPRTPFCALPVLLLALAEATDSQLVVPWSESLDLAFATWSAFFWRVLCALVRAQRLPPGGTVGPAGVVHTAPPPERGLFPSVVGRLGKSVYTNRTLEGPPPGWLEVYPLRLYDGGSITVRARSESIGCRGPNDFVTLHASATSENDDFIDWAPVTELDYGQFVDARGAAWAWARGGFPWRVGIRGNDRLYVRFKRLPAPCGPHYSVPTVHVPPAESQSQVCAQTGAKGSADEGTCAAGAGGGDRGEGGAGSADADGETSGRWVALEARETQRVFFYDEAEKRSTWFRRETSWGGAEDGWARLTVYDPEAAPCVERERSKQWSSLIKAGPKATDPKPPRLPSAAIEVRYWCNLTDVLDASELGASTHVRYIMGARTGAVYFERLPDQWEHPSVLASRTLRKDAPGTTMVAPGPPRPPQTPPPNAAGGRAAGESATSVAASKKPQAGVPRDEKFERYRLFSRFRRMRRRGLHHA